MPDAQAVRKSSMLGTMEDKVRDTVLPDKAKALKVSAIDKFPKKPTAAHWAGVVGSGAIQRNILKPQLQMDGVPEELWTRHDNIRFDWAAIPRRGVS